MSASFDQVSAPALSVRAAGIDDAQPRPRLVPETPPYRYAVLVVTGTPADRAAQLLAVDPATARRWRRALVAEARAYFGEPVSYAFAAWYALSPELRNSIARFRAQNTVPEVLTLSGLG
jgi:hypothetical protein